MLAHLQPPAAQAVPPYPKFAISLYSVINEVIVEILCVDYSDYRTHMCSQIM